MSKNLQIGQEINFSHPTKDGIEVKVKIKGIHKKCYKIEVLSGQFFGLYIHENGPFIKSYLKKQEEFNKKKMEDSKVEELTTPRNKIINEDMINACITIQKYIRRYLTNQTLKIIKLNKTKSRNTQKVKRKSKNAEFLEKWEKCGKSIPNCINNNCTNPVAIRHWSAQGIPSLKTECSRCSTSRIKGKTIPGIVFHKKIYCENRDSILGFKCPMDPQRYGEFPSDCYDMDHRDGNHNNNTLDNLITICKVCHQRKGKDSDDFNSHKESSRIHK
tara:strand:+ start:983 stop:1801 length:819 start_codon:yes stop_codon:yes gene_type:complete